MQLLKPLLPFTAVFILLLFAQDLTTIALTNGIIQVTVFAFVVCLPTWRTGRMSYVDIGWPLGLVIIGLVAMFLSDGNTVRSAVIGFVYLLIGGRMAGTAIVMWRQGELDTELPRYQYQRIRWERRGVTNTRLVMQVEVLSQCLANISFLALPALIIATNPNPEMHILEVLGLSVWLGAFLMEHIADMQKRAFIKNMTERGKKNQVCNVGLWRYTRHPNYFSEWMVWNGIIITAIPSWLDRFSNDHIAIWALLGFCLFFITRVMYTTLVHYSGAKPSEHYSAQKRPDYAEYQKTTNQFFPSPPKVPS